MIKYTIIIDLFKNQNLFYLLQSKDVSTNYKNIYFNKFDDIINIIFDIKIFFVEFLEILIN